MSNIKQELLDSYTEANYHVYANPSFILKIGQSSKELRKLLTDLNVKFAAFITAFNPYSIELELIENKLRNKNLEEKIKSMQLHYIKGDGRCRKSNEVGEEGFLIFGITRDEASLLGKQSEQNAIVYCEVSSIPDLILLR